MQRTDSIVTTVRWCAVRQTWVAHTALWGIRGGRYGSIWAVDAALSDLQADATAKDTLQQMVDVMRARLSSGT